MLCLSEVFHTSCTVLLTKFLHSLATSEILQISWEEIVPKTMKIVCAKIHGNRISPHGDKLVKRGAGKVFENKLEHPLKTKPLFSGWLQTVPHAVTALIS